MFTSDTWNTCICWRIDVLCHSHKLIYREKEEITVINTNAYVYTILRHMKDQNKKVANLKHNQQMEKKKNAQLLEEVRRREDNMTDNSQHLQVSLFFNCVLKPSKIVHFCFTVCLPGCIMNLFPQRADVFLLSYQRMHYWFQLHPWNIYYLGKKLQNLKPSPHKDCSLLI